MTKLICAKDMIAMHRSIMGATLIEMFRYPPEPYRIWSVDIYICPMCECRVMSGHSDNPINHYDKNFKEEWEAIQSNVDAGFMDDAIFYQFERIEDAKEYKETMESKEVDDAR